ncbi:MAG: rhomboid family intramembrane serine protease [Antricoccus sp.]
MTSAAVGFQCPDCMADGRATVRGPSSLATGRKWLRKHGTVTIILIALNVLMYAATCIDARSITNNQRSGIFLDLAMWGPAVDAGQWWRLIGSAFLHYGPTHIAVNMLSLYLLGSDVERFFGSVRFAVVYLVSGVGASIAVWIFTPNAVVAGASGAVFGLFGAAAVVLIGRKADLRPLLMILLLNLGISLLPGISLAAHAGGFIVGGLVALVMQRTARRIGS